MKKRKQTDEMTGKMIKASDKNENPGFINLNLIAFNVQETFESETVIGHNNWIQDLLLMDDVVAGCIKGIPYRDDIIFNGRELPKYIIEETKINKQFKPDVHSEMGHLLALSDGLPVVKVMREFISFNADLDLQYLELMNIKNLEVIKDNDLINKIQKLMEEQNKES